MNTISILLSLFTLLSKVEPPVVAQPSRQVEISQDQQNEQIIGIGDEILISAPNVEEIGEKVLFVGGSGKVFLPLAGEVQASSLTITQFATAIARAISPYVKEPEIFVSIKSSAQNKICISGEVNRPGVYRFIDGYTIGEALNLAGGVAMYADLEQIRVKGVNKDSVFDMQTAQKILVEPYDEIYVQKFKDILIIGEVIEPEAFTPTASKVKLSEVIGYGRYGRGFTQYANFRKVKIISPDTERAGKSKAQIVKMSAATEVEVNPGDVIVILSKRNLIHDLLEFTLHYAPIVTLGLMIYWHYSAK
ncbi:MAG: polysaccharide export protein [Candidatus Stahlbacteria bacterium]|nr:polysaccharide export protein [Candidatus Stahlbacteria bacterium]